MGDEPEWMQAEPLEQLRQDSTLKHLAVFLRSVIPVDSWQLVFLIGVVFIFIVPRLSWLPDQLITSPKDNFRPDPIDLGKLRLVASICSTISLAAALVGYFTCFWPGRRPLRRIVWAVILPAAAIVGIAVRGYFGMTHQSSTLFESPHPFPQFYNWLFASFGKFPTAIYFALFGLVLVSIYASRLTVGIASLPISLRSGQISNDDCPHSWPRIRLLLFVLVGLLPVLGRLLGFLLAGLLLAFSPTSMAVFLRFAPALDAALIVGISLYILGKQGRVAARSSLRLPEPRYALIAALLPAIVNAVPPTGKYLLDRTHWAAQDFGKFAPPQFSSYFDFTSAWQPWLLLLVVGAFAEEFVFRGLLLRGFIGRYGLHRGIFLTGIAWAAIHFQSDSYAGLSVSGVFIHLINRVFLCLALNYVFVWMTLRWKSIVPPAIAHTAWNILAAMQMDSSGPWDWELRFALLATLAYVLFRFWPVTAEETSQGAQREASPEPAV